MLLLWQRLLLLMPLLSSWLTSVQPQRRHDDAGARVRPAGVGATA
jgi:hypothetical protein